MKFKKLIIALSCALLVFGCGDDKERTSQNEQTAPIQTTAQIEQAKPQETPSIAQTQEQKPAIKAQSENEFELAFLSGEKFPLKKDGERFEMADKDKATLFVFFATWCPPCKAEIPHLNNLNDKFKKELNIVAVLLEDKELPEISKFAEKYNIKYNISVGEGNFLLEKAMGGIEGLPSSALFKPNGEFFSGYRGMVPEEMMERDILKAIE